MDVPGEGGGKRRERAHSFLTSVAWPLTTHPIEDGAPFVLVLETHSAVLEGGFTLFNPFYVVVFCEANMFLFVGFRPVRSPYLG